MGEKNSTNNTDPEVNPDVEHTFGGGTFNFSSPSNPSENTSTFGSERRFYAGNGKL